MSAPAESTFSTDRVGFPALWSRKTFDLSTAMRVLGLALAIKNAQDCQGCGEGGGGERGLIFFK